MFIGISILQLCTSHQSMTLDAPCPVLVILLASRAKNEINANEIGRCLFVSHVPWQHAHDDDKQTTAARLGTSWSSWLIYNTLSHAICLIVILTGLSVPGHRIPYSPTIVPVFQPVIFSNDVGHVFDSTTSNASTSSLLLVVEEEVFLFNYIGGVVRASFGRWCQPNYECKYNGHFDKILIVTSLAAATPIDFHWRVLLCMVRDATKLAGIFARKAATPSKTLVGRIQQCSQSNGHWPAPKMGPSIQYIPRHLQLVGPGIFHRLCSQASFDSGGSFKQSYICLAVGIQGDLSGFYPYGPSHWRNDNLVWW